MEPQASRDTVVSEILDQPSGETGRFSWDDIGNLFSDALDLGFEVTFVLCVVAQGQQVTLLELRELVNAKKGS
jgi:hypothetical protein